MARTVGDPWADAQAAVVGCARPAVVTDFAAARLWELPLPPWALGQVDEPSVAVKPDQARPRRQGVRGRRLRLPPSHVTQVGGLAITTPARTWLDCAARLSVSDCVVMGDALLHRGLASDVDLRQLLAWGYRRRGVARIRAAYPVLDEASESPGESRARYLLVSKGIERPVCNLNIYSNGRWLARVDMAWPDRHIIVEYDGAGHREERRRRRDAQRLNDLQEAGWLVIVLTADDLGRPERTVQLVRRALASR